MYRNTVNFCKFLFTALVLCCFYVNAYGEDSWLQICGEKEYVSRCGSYTIGIRWMKGGPAVNGTNTKNYYDYSGQNNVKNLRIFLSNTEEPITYTDSLGREHTVTFSGTNGYKTDQGDFLHKYCRTASDIVCTKCPNGASVAKSSIYRGTGDGDINKWDLRTIFDCYKNKFSDSTGTFEYVNNTTDLVVQNCYYSQDVLGDQILTENAIHIENPGYNNNEVQ